MGEWIFRHHLSCWSATWVCWLSDLSVKVEWELCHFSSGMWNWDTRKFSVHSTSWYRLCLCVCSAEDESWANEWNSIYLNKTRDRMGKRDDLLNEKWENCVCTFFMCGKDAAMLRQRKFINMSSVGLRCCVRYCQAQPHTDRHSPPSWVWNVRLDEKLKKLGKAFCNANLCTYTMRKHFNSPLCRSVCSVLFLFP